MKLVQKLLIIMSTTLLATSSYAAAFRVSSVVDCQILPEESKEIARIRIVANIIKAEHPYAPIVHSGGLIVNYRNGAQQNLLPAPRKDAFGNETFDSQMQFSGGRVYFPNSAVGEILVDYRCYLAKRIPWERCQSQGTGEYGKLSRVLISLPAQKKVIRLTGNRLCHRLQK